MRKDSLLVKNLGLGWSSWPNSQRSLSQMFSNAIWFQCSKMVIDDIKPRKENGSSRLNSHLGEVSRPRLQPTPDSPSVRLPGSNRENTTISISMLDILKRQPSPSSCWIFGKGNHLNLILDAGTNWQLERQGWVLAWLMLFVIQGLTFSSHFMATYKLWTISSSGAAFSAKDKDQDQWTGNCSKRWETHKQLADFPSS